jgi:hypothetical protein
VVFFPVQSYTFPATANPNVIPSSWNNITDAVSTTGPKFTYSPTNYQTLHLVNVLCADGFIALTSPDFQALTQHSICTEHGGLAGSYSQIATKNQNPPPAPSTAPPLAINGCSPSEVGKTCDPASNAIDVFFVNFYGGTGVSTPQYGFSWINGDGVSIGSGVFSAQPRYDTLAHETGHALALTHVNFGATTDTVNAPVGNMMLLGTTRATSYNSGCQNITTPSIYFSGSISSPPPVYRSGALYDLDYITSSFNPCAGAGAMQADHLVPQPANAPSACPSPLDPTTCFTQEGAAALSPFINKTATNTATTNNGGGSQAPIAGAAMTSTATPSGPGTPAPLSITITADGDPNDPNVPDLASTIIALLPNDPLSFNGNDPITQIGGTGCSKDSSGNYIIPVQNCAVTFTEMKLTNQQVTGNPGCDSGTGQPPSSQCVRLTYSAGFRPGMFVIIAVSFNKDASVIISNNLLTGAQYTSIDANEFATTTLFGPVLGLTIGTPDPRCMAVGQVIPPSSSDNGGTCQIVGFSADSGQPDLTTPNVLLNAQTFQNTSAVKLFKQYGNYKIAQCTPPYIIVGKGSKAKTVCPDRNLPDGPD